MKALPLLTREEIKRGFITAGWEAAGPSRYPIVGNPNDISITAHEQCADTEDSAFELIDCRLSLIYWVRVIPTPRQAVVLLWERGGPPE